MLNEVIFDIFGILVEFYDNCNLDWEIGEDIYMFGKVGDVFCFMSDLVKYGDLDYYFKCYIGISDNGGVYINSGIINK